MQTIELDGSLWSDRLDFWYALREALGVIPAHGTGFDAFEDSVFYNSEMLAVRAPFTVIVRNPPSATRSDIEEMAKGWAFQRQWRKENYGDDVEALIPRRRRLLCLYRAFADGGSEMKPSRLIPERLAAAITCVTHSYRTSPDKLMVSFDEDKPLR